MLLRERERKNWEPMSTNESKIRIWNGSKNFSKSRRVRERKRKKRVIAQLLLLLFNCIEYNIELCPGLHNSHYITIDCCIRLYIRPIGTFPSIWRFQPSSLPSRIIIDVRPLTLYYTQSHYYYLLLYREFCETRDERKRERGEGKNRH